MTQSVQSTEVGQTLDACLYEELNKNPQTQLSNADKQFLYIDFWASWCPPCVKSFPFLNDLHEQYKSTGLKIIAVNLDENTEDANKFLARFPADFTIALDFSKSCAKKLGISAMPSSFLVDQQGIVRHVHLGFRSSQTAEIRQQVKQLFSKAASATPL